jgi:trans-aconitate methyltransferase
MGEVVVATTAGTAGEQPPRAVSLDFDTTVAHPSRVYDYWLGGKDNFAADREAAERVLAVTPGLRMRVQANRAFLVRAVRFLAGPADRPAASAAPIASAGISQFLDIGTGIPSANNTHEVAQSVNPAARIVYVDNDPIVLAHARALLTSAKGGATDYAQADLRNPEPILEAAARTLDFEQPIAIILLGVLHLVQDDEDPWGIVRRLMAAVPTGSYLAISHPALDIHPAQAEAQRRYNERVSTPQTLRTRDQVARFFTDLELVEPGLVQVHQWRPDPSDVVPEDAASAHGAVARKH